MFQYHVPKNHNKTESYAPCVLFLLHPIKVEFHLKSGSPPPHSFSNCMNLVIVDIKPFKKKI